MKKKHLFYLFVLVPFVLGTIGYCTQGIDFTDAAYGSFALYFVNPVMDEKNLPVEAARWLAPLTLAGGVLLTIKEIGYKVKHFFRSLDKRTVAIYSDNPFGEMLEKNIRHSIRIQDDSVYDTKNVIIMYANDSDALKFYQDNRRKIKNKNVYMKLDSFHPLCIGNSDVKYFNMNDMIARDYWKSHNLSEYCKNNEKHIKIAIVGFNDLGERILNSGLLNNIFSLDQCIEYHIWGDSVLYENLHTDFHTMNHDKIVYHKSGVEEEICMLTEMDRIIVVDSTDYHLLTSIFEICPHNKIDCFSPDGSLVNSIYDNDKIDIFGNYESLLTKENIITDKLYEQAMKLHYRYAHPEDTPTDPGKPGKWDWQELKDAWNALNSFTKLSNVAAADYYNITKEIMGTDETDDVLCELEHIRWCRFHFLNHWKYGQTENGKKDSNKRIHPCLIPYSELSETEKEKDKDAVKMLIGLNG